MLRGRSLAETKSNLLPMVLNQGILEYTPLTMIILSGEIPSMRALAFSRTRPSKNGQVVGQGPASDRAAQHEELLKYGVPQSGTFPLVVG